MTILSNANLTNNNAKRELPESIRIVIRCKIKNATFNIEIALNMFFGKIP
jgi:hypothetical protein